MEKIKVSVIIPVWNAEKFIKRCLNSLKNQTLKECEFICINDGSTDGTLKILKKFQEQDHRFIIKNIKNSGPSIARNIGIEQAKGEYIAFLDNDDAFAENYCEQLYNVAIKNNLDVCVCPMRHIYSHKSKNFEIKNRNKGRDLISSLTIKQVEVWGKLYKKSFLNKYKIRQIERKKSADVLFLYTVLFHHPKLGVCENSYYKRYVRKGSLFATYQTFEILDRYVELYHDLENSNMTPKEKNFWRKYLQKGICSLFVCEYSLLFKNKSHIKIIFNRLGFIKKFKYWILSKITLGKTKEKYKQKYAILRGLK